MQPFTIKAVNFSDVLDALGIRENDVDTVHDAFALRAVFGDANYTLIDVRTCWSHLHIGLGWCRWSDDLIEHTKVKLFSIVGNETYINMEG